jgi:hypothetical protein
MLPRRSLLAAVIAFSALAPPRAVADGPYVSITESATWQDNADFAPSGDGIRSAFSLASGTTVSWMHSLDFSTLLNAAAAADIDLCTTFSGLDNMSVGGSAEVSHKLGLGAYAPVLYAGLVGCATGFTDPERSNVEGDLTFGASQRLRDDLQVVLDGRLGSYDARDIVFSGNYASLCATLNWDLSETWRIKLTGGWRDGDNVSDYAAVRSPYGWVAADQDAQYLPGAWHYVRTFNDPFVAYRVSARTWSYGAGISPALGRHTSLTLQFAHFDAAGFDSYEDNVVSLSLEHHF